MATANYEKRTCNITDGDGSRPVPVGLPRHVQITAALCRRCWLSSKLVSLNSGFCTYKFLHSKNDSHRALHLTTLRSYNEHRRICRSSQ